jgi:Fe-S-cluster containining protein
MLFLNYLKIFLFPLDIELLLLYNGIVKNKKYTIMTKIEVIICGILLVADVVLLAHFIKIRRRAKKYRREMQKQKLQKVQKLFQLMRENAVYLPCRFYGKREGQAISGLSYVFNEPKCTNLVHLCGAMCCHCVPFHKYQWEQVKAFVPEGVRYTLEVYGMPSHHLVQPKTENGKCVFLGASNQCVIYTTGLRPEICQTFGDVYAKTEDAVAYSCPYLNPHMYNDRWMCDGLLEGTVKLDFTVKEGSTVILLPSGAGEILES